MNSITKRWVRSSLLVTIGVLLVALGIFLYYSITGFYNYAGTAILDQINMINSQLSLFSSSPAAEKSFRMIRAVEQFEEKTKFELLLVDARGNAVISSSGVLPTQATPPPDVVEALSPNTEETGYYVGPNENGEKVMAMTELTPYSVDGIVAMRLVTSMTGVDKSIQNLVIMAFVFLFVIMLASVISGVFFIRSIVLPLQKVEVTAARISEGDFDTRIENDSDDEIGSLCKTINHMAEELGRTERMKNEFISSVSHELRTPLTSIKGWTETVGSVEGPEDPTFRRGVKIIAGEADRLYDMVEELLDFSRMQGAGLDLKPELLDLAAEVEEAVLLAGSRASNMGMEVLYAAPELPVPVMADKNRVRQVLINILDNAIKYSDNGDRIWVDILQDGRNAHVLITDEGAGIDPDDLENVKMRFYKGRGATRGSGIGLAVADEIMEGHDGSLEIASELGKGTEVTLRFPLWQKTKETNG